MKNREIYLELVVNVKTEKIEEFPQVKNTPADKVSAAKTRFILISVLLSQCIHFNMKIFSSAIKTPRNKKSNEIKRVQVSFEKM